VPGRTPAGFVPKPRSWEWVDIPTFAMLAGVAPLPASSGQTVRYRMNRRGDRQLNQTLYIIARTRLRHDEATKAYAIRRVSEGKTLPEIRRCLKRYIARELFRLLEATPAT
jgi:transposase